MLSSNSFYMRFIMLVIIVALFSCPAFTQKLLIDSIKGELSRADVNEKPIIRAELARTLFEKDIEQAVKQGYNALALAKKNNNAGAKAFCYATVGHLLVQKKQQKRAAKYIDSAVRCAAKSNNATLAAFAWFRKGWLEMVEGHDDKAMPALIKAGQMLEPLNDQRSLSYKTLVNHYVASIYSYGSDTLKQRKYAWACWRMAQKSGNPDDLQLGCMTVAHSFFSTFEKNKTRRPLLDSAVHYFRESLNLYQHNRGKILLQSNASATALNLANSYFKYFTSAYKDSAFRYINMALSIARRTNGHEVIANCYGILSEYALRNRDFVKAEQYLQTGIAELNGTSGGTDITRSRLMLGLANVAEAQGNMPKALQYYKSYNAYYTKVFDAQKLNTIQQLEEEYQAVQRDNEIVRLRERANYNNRLKWLYVAIGAVSVVSLILLLSSYHYRLKVTMQQKQLAEQEKDEIELMAQLQNAEAQRLKLEKQEAELQASLQEKESARLQAQQALLQDRTEWLEKELMAGSLKIEEKNIVLQSLQEKAKQTGSPAVSRQIGRIINQNLRMDKNSAEQQSILTQVNSSFFNALQNQANHTLTRLDLKYCAYILMGLDTKEIASRLNVEPKSIRMARYRLKQKLKLPRDLNLDIAIRSFNKLNPDTDS
jgi:DNA-binding CsgD family transcriptional regulator